VSVVEQRGPERSWDWRIVGILAMAVDEPCPRLGDHDPTTLMLIAGDRARRRLDAVPTVVSDLVGPLHGALACQQLNLRLRVAQRQRLGLHIQGRRGKARRSRLGPQELLVFVEGFAGGVGAHFTVSRRPVK